MLGFPRILPLAQMRGPDDLFAFFDDLMGHQKTFDLDVKNEDSKLVVRADLPGVRKEDLTVTLEKGVLTISAERSSERDEKDGDFQVRERQYGKFYRSIQVPGDIDSSSIVATLEGGVLQLILPQAEECQPKRIEIK